VNHHLTAAAWRAELETSARQRLAGRRAARRELDGEQPERRVLARVGHAVTPDP